MQTPFKLRLMLLSVVLVLSACGSLPQQSSPIKTAVVNSNTVISKASVGTRMSLPAGNELGLPSVLVVDEYLAASGRICRLVEVEPLGDETRVMCQRVSGEWGFTRALISSAFRQEITPRVLAASPLVEGLPESDSGVVDVATQQMTTSSAFSAADPLVDNELLVPTSALSPQVQLQMEPRETLWRFAARTTGKGENWQHIAKLNGITDVSKIRPELMLSVPTKLVETDR